MPFTKKREKEVGVPKLYTDLLLHDMGAGLVDNRPNFLATGTEWRTAPLWGNGLFGKTNATPFYLHDGRARTLDSGGLIYK